MLLGCQPQIHKQVVYKYTPDEFLLHPCKEDYREIIDPVVLGEMYLNNTICLRMYKENLNSIIALKHKQSEK